MVGIAEDRELADAAGVRYAVFTGNATVSPAA
jgi:hypothetical protein